MTPQSDSLVPFAGTLTERARRLVELSAGRLKRFAMKAANEKAAEDLWQLLEAHLATFGRSGSLVSRHTLRAYRKGLEVYLAFASDRGVNILHPTHSQAASFVRHLETNGLSPSTIRVRVGAVKALYRALRWADATSDVPFADVRPAADATAPWDKVTPYSANEIVSMLEAVFRESDRTLILLGAHAGLRISEAVNLRWNQVDLDTGEIVITGKGRRVRRVLLSQSLVDEMSSLDSKEDHVFGFGDQEARRRLRQITGRAGVPWRGFHALRHHAGTELYRATTSLDSVARHLGHANVETARVYAKWADEQLRTVLQKW